MDRIDQFDVFKLGAACKAVSVLPGAPSFFDALTPLLDLKRALRALSDGQPVPVRHCRGDLEKLIKQVDVLMEDFQNEEGKLDPKKDWNQPINEFGRRRLGSLLNRFEITFAAEMRETSTFRHRSPGRCRDGALSIVCSRRPFGGKQEGLFGGRKGVLHSAYTLPLHSI
jgi:hypothetical protein